MDLRRAAARDNAAWCDLVCRAHGLDTAVDPGAWVSRRRSPPAYPDAVTLRDDVTWGALASRLDGSPGCSVKDSYATLDLSGEGFRVLFEAEWIHREPPAATPRRWSRWAPVRTADDLEAWAVAHGGGPTFRASLLEEPTVTVLAARDEHGEVVAGVVGSRTGAVVGLSNLFSTRPDHDRVWAEAADALALWAPGLPLVGYERGDSLAAARRAGFSGLGALRVWLRG
ncbi:hypothetical protein [Cellulomonas cellasea]|uniref:N-acetyltransferase domain-containing protein n=1 Tax=Cellulomonas cellasea TaxID=43670 RepID=A0A7W4YC55_9CELL|nr:hypothetical protein [Cellulomonas cellasea]MBB2923377.1 hypothetical protein [Cellulomonas cellasea]